ncbi:hypothetical protein EG329_005766 [Mollisiaceae sp. DMI_Dod_QoI]|nr:hypothetical protein EG329_005766 [Helotiales sp. DMI_Dod_QoI]
MEPVMKSPIYPMQQIDSVETCSSQPVEYDGSGSDLISLKRVERGSSIVAENMFDRLPDEMLLLIFSQFWKCEWSGWWHFPLDSRGVRLVCSRWNAIATPCIYRDIVVTPFLLKVSDKSFRSLDLENSNGNVSNDPGQMFLHNMFAYSKHFLARTHNFAPYDWDVFASILPACRNLRSVRFTFPTKRSSRRTGQQPEIGSTFPLALYDAIQNRPHLQLYFEGFIIGANLSKIPVSNLVRFQGDLRVQVSDNHTRLQELLSKSRLEEVDIGTHGFWVLARMRRRNPASNWDWSKVRTLKLVLDNGLQQDNIFQLFTAAPFSRLRKLAYQNLGETDEQLELTRLRSLLTNTKIRQLTLFIKHPLGNLISDFGKVSRHLRHLTVKHLRTQELLALGAACPNLSELVLYWVDYNDEHNGTTIFEGFGRFPNLKHLHLHEMKTSIADLKGIDGAREQANERLQKINANRVNLIPMVDVCGYYKRDVPGRDQVGSVTLRQDPNLNPKLKWCPCHAMICLAQRFARINLGTLDEHIIIGG